jgi:hypothetical protein
VNGQTRVNGTTNGTRRVPVLGDWQTVPLGGLREPEPARATAEPAPAAPVVVDPIAAAEAEAIRARTLAETETARIRALADADAIRTRAGEEVEKQRIANARSQMRLERETAEHATKIAELNKRREDAEREAEAARQAVDEAREAESKSEAARARSRSVWKWCALGFAIACAIVALPVQMAAFWDPHAKWLLAAPLMLEGGAWVVLQGAAAAVNDHRPHWHYRLIAWCLAFVAAGINLSHGLSHFGITTAIGTAFASVAGPGIWDLHEHGRIRLRDGRLTRRERRAKRAEEKRALAEKAKHETEQKQAREAADKAADEAAQQLAADREREYPEVWKHALALRAALGETTVTEAMWKRAHRDIEGADPGESVDTIRTRRTAEIRVAKALGETPPNTPSKVVNAQRANQMPRAQRGPARKPPVRRSGDTQQYVAAARKQAAIAAKNAAQKDA